LLPFDGNNDYSVKGNKNLILPGALDAVGTICRDDGNKYDATAAGNAAGVPCEAGP